MIQPTEYTISERLYLGKRSVIYRGLRKRDGLPVVVKTHVGDYPTEIEAVRFNWEFEIGKGFDNEHIVKYYAIESLPQKIALIIEDFGGIGLANILPKGGFDMELLLSIALQLTEGLDDIHRQNVIHRDIKPANIVIKTDTYRAKFIDFGISSRLAHEPIEGGGTGTILGTPRYISPEQTGRISRTLDYRTDFYSLGATLYELATGRTPFVGDDPLELVHCHLAKQPVPPHEISSVVPENVSSVVMKLLAKDADDRYQSCAGLAADLKRCRKDLGTRDDAFTFVPGQEDYTGDLKFSRRLFGRDKEMEDLTTALRRAAAGDPQFLVVSGSAGLGKTALLNSFRESVERLRYYSVFCSIDPSLQNSPYSTIFGAFDDVVRRILSEPKENIERWRHKAQAAVGNNGQILIDIVPSLETLIGPQPAVPRLEPMENKNRFDLLFRNFIRVFDRPDHPLVVSFDDLHQIDSDAFEPMRLLLSEGLIRNFLFVGTYRENDGEVGRPLKDFLDSVGPKVEFELLELDALRITDLEKLVLESLPPETTNLRSLVDLLFRKTLGNPFFIREFLESLKREEILRFDKRDKRWICDLSAAEALDATDNVVAILSRRIDGFSSESRSCLGLAACLGNRFDPDILARLKGGSLSDIADALLPIVEAGLLKGPDTNRLYLRGMDLITSHSAVSETPINLEFADSRYYETARSLIVGSERAGIHLRIARILMDSIPEGEYGAKLFDLVDHLNRTGALITDSDEIERVVRLNLVAGREARESNSYLRSLTYLREGLARIPNRWIEVDLKRLLTVERFNLICVPDIDCGLEGFDLEYHDGRNWLLESSHETSGLSPGCYTIAVGHVAARKWRVSNFRFGQRLPAVPIIGVEINGTAVSASQYFSSCHPKNVLNTYRGHFIASKIWTNFTRFRPNDWLMVDFLVPKTITRIVVQTFSFDTVGVSVGGIKAFDLLYQSESDWVTLGTYEVATADSCLTEITFDAVTAGRWRIANFVLHQGRTCAAIENLMFFNGDIPIETEMARNGSGNDFEIRFDQWENASAFSRKLYSSLAQSAHLSGKHELVDLYHNLVKNGEHSAIGKVSAYESMIKTYRARGDYYSSLSASLEILDQLGVPIPSEPDDSMVQEEYQKTLDLLAERNTDALAELPVMSDPDKKAAMRILNESTTAAYLFQNIYRVITFARIRLSCEYGNTPETASAYVSLANLLVDDERLEKACQVGRLGLKIMDGFDSKEQEVYTRLQYHRFISHWEEYTWDTLPDIRKASQTGADTGDLFLFSDSVLMYFAKKRHYIENMTDFRREVTRFKRIFSDYGLTDQSGAMDMLHQFYAIEQGETETPNVLSGEYADGMTRFNSSVAYKQSGIERIAADVVSLETWYGDPRQAVRLAEKAMETLDVLPKGPIGTAYFNHAYSVALLATCPDAPDREREGMLSQVEANQARMGTWADNAPENFSHLYHHIEALRAGLLNRKRDAQELFDRTRSLCREYRYLQMEAHVARDAGKFWLNAGNDVIAKAYIQEALILFQRLENWQQCRTIEEHYPHLLAVPDVPRGKRDTSAVDREGVRGRGDNAMGLTFDQTGSTSSSIASASLDLATVVKATRAMSEEIDLERLLEKIMGIIVENAGAENGSILLESAGELNVEVAHSVRTVEVRPLESASIDGSRNVSEAIVRYAHRTGENVVLQDAAREGAFTQDPYVLENRPKSILCIPFGRRDKASGVLYLENNLIPTAFTTDRIELLNILLGQASISLENAMLFKQHLNSAEETRRLRNYLRNVVDSMPSVLVGVDSESRVIHWNREAEQTTGLTADLALGKSLSDVFPHLAEVMKNVLRSIRSGIFLKEEKIVGYKAGEIHYFDLLVYPLVANGIEGAVVKIDDVTKRVRLEETMIQNEKMMSVGRLAAGMAHEINNPLGGIMQGAQNILRRISPELKKNVKVAEECGLDLNVLHNYLEKRNILSFLEGIRESGVRAAKIIGNMLQFSRSSESQMAPTDLADLLERTIELANNDYDLKKKFDFRHIEIVREFDPKLESVSCNETEIEQVVLNLLKNAAQAMAEEDRPASPRIALRTKVEGDMARIEVEDNGPGMDEKTRQKAFEPFFTTKPAGIGTGLGLSVSYMIVANNHKGTMEIESVPSKGTRFVIRLPLDKAAGDGS
ncbi:MAG: AAA family ATPase [Proteobacteria bacterium]|nr:AAA family ATPase [Pseudomonadota bacterium]